MTFPNKKLLACALGMVLASACSRGRNRVLDVDYVSAPQVTLRDQLSQVYNKVGIVKNGERVEVLERERRFARVKTGSGVEGWVEQRYLVGQPIYDAFQKLAQEEKDAPVEGTAATRNDTNLHVSPGRETDHLYQLAEGAKVSVLKRATVEKDVPGAGKPGLGPNRIASRGKKDAGPAMEDWWLVRDPQNHVGWVLGRLIDLDVPLEVAQYAEGQRIVGCFELNSVRDGDKQVPQYLMLLTEAKDGLPFDYNQVRVFTWNVRRHRYETAYRERNLSGILPVIVSHETFEKEGDLPTFTLHVQDANGSLTERKYKMNTPMVRRVG